MTLVKVKVERGRLTQYEAKASRREEIFRREPVSVTVVILMP